MEKDEIFDQDTNDLILADWTAEWLVQLCGIDGYSFDEAMQIIEMKYNGVDYET